MFASSIAGCVFNGKRTYAGIESRRKHTDAGIAAKVTDITLDDTVYNVEGTVKNTFLPYRVLSDGLDTNIDVEAEVLSEHGLGYINADTNLVLGVSHEVVEDVSIGEKASFDITLIHDQWPSYEPAYYDIRAEYADK